MTDEQKQYIHLHFSMLKQAMKQEGLIFGIAVDKTEPDNSMLCIVDKEQFFSGKQCGIMISLQELNRDLW